jgi:hypothetical protein
LFSNPHFQSDSFRQVEHRQMQKGSGIIDHQLLASTSEPSISPSKLITQLIAFASSPGRLTIPRWRFSPLTGLILPSIFA